MIGAPEAEAAFLGCLLQKITLMSHGYLRQVEEEDFASAQHRAVFTAMQQLMEARQPVDPITVLGQMRRTGLEACMTDDRSAGVFLADLMAAAPSLGSVGHYLLVILEHRARRVVEETGIRLQQVAGSSDIDSVREQLDRDGREITRAFARLASRHEAEYEDVDA